MATPSKVKAALLEIGFDGVYEVAQGADDVSVSEAEEFLHQRNRFNRANTGTGMSQTALAIIGYLIMDGDDVSVSEAEEFLEKVPEELPFLATSCCPAWSVFAKRTLGEKLAGCVSCSLTPMVATARHR